MEYIEITNPTRKKCFYCGLLTVRATKYSELVLPSYHRDPTYQSTMIDLHPIENVKSQSMVML